MSDAMRVLRALCAILILVSCAPLVAGGQHDRGLAASGNTPFPPAVPAPLYFADPFDHQPRTTRLHASRYREGGMVLVSQRTPEDEFKPISELPPEEKLPAAPMLVAAYVFVVLALSAYVLSIARRLNAVGREIAKLESQIKRH
jgi:hypothetical protein